MLLIQLLAVAHVAIHIDNKGYIHGNLKDCNLKTSRSRHPKMFREKGVLRNFAKFTGKHLCQSLFSNKVAGFRPATLLKKRLWHRIFPVNFTNSLRTPFLTEHLRWLLLNFKKSVKSAYCISWKKGPRYYKISFHSKYTTKFNELVIKNTNAQKIRPLKKWLHLPHG